MEQKYYFLTLQVVGRVNLDYAVTNQNPAEYAMSQYTFHKENPSIGYNVRLVNHIEITEEQYLRYEEELYTP